METEKLTSLANGIVRKAFAPTVDIQPRDYDKKTKTFTIEISEMGMHSAPRMIFIRNPKTKQKQKFKMFKTDKSDSGLDIAGWWYKNEKGDLKLLVIND